MHVQQSIMSTAELKKILKTSEGAPVNCAVGIVDLHAVMLLSRLKNPKALEKMLQHMMPSIKSTQSGTATADIKTVKMTLNKSASGLQRRLVKALKGSGYNKVEVNGESYEDVEEAVG